MTAGPAYLFVTETRRPSARVLAAPAVSLSHEELARAGAFRDFEGAIPVLTFHDVSDRPGPYNLTPQQLAADLAILRAAGFSTVRLPDVARFLAGEPVSLPRRPILITFDDGITSAWTSVDPILARNGFSAVAFLITGRIAPHEPSYYLTWDQVDAMRNTGRWEFGAHTHRSHDRVALPGGGSGPALINRAVGPDGLAETLVDWRTRVLADLEESDRTFEQRLGRRPSVFAFPFTAADAPTNDAAIVSEIGAIIQQRYPMAFVGAAPNPVVMRSSNPAALPRIGLRAGASPTDLLARLQQALPAPPPSDLSTLDWRPGAGDACEAAHGVVTLRADSYGRCDVQGNSALWQDYEVTTTVRAESAKATAIVALRSSSSGRVEVAMGESRLQVRQQVGKAEWLPLGELPLAPASQPLGRSLRINVVGQQLTVEVDGRTTPAFVLDPALRTGFVGFAAATPVPQSISFTASGCRLVGSDAGAGGLWSD